MATRFSIGDRIRLRLDPEITGEIIGIELWRDNTFRLKIHWDRGDLVTYARSNSLKPIGASHNAIKGRMSHG